MLRICGNGCYFGNSFCNKLFRQLWELFTYRHILFLFAVAFLVNVILEVVLRKRYNFKRSLVWVCSLGGSFTLFLIVMLSVLFSSSESAFLSVLTCGLNILVSYVIAFIAKTMLHKTTADVTEDKNNLSEADTKQTDE